MNTHTKQLQQIINHLRGEATAQDDLGAFWQGMGDADKHLYFDGVAEKLNGHCAFLQALMSPLPATDPDGNPYPATGHVIIDAVIRAAAIEKVIVEDNVTITVWAAHAADQIEAALAESGWILMQNDQGDGRREKTPPHE